MRQIFLHHRVGHLTNRGTEVASGPEVSPPVALFQHGEFLEQLARGAALDPAHDFARGHVRRGRDEDMHVILAHHPLQDLDLEELTGLPHHLSYPQGDISGEHLVAILGDPYEVILGFDHGVGHSLLLLYDAKTSHGENIINFNGLSYDPSAGLYKFILDHNKIYH